MPSTFTVKVRGTPLSGTVSFESGIPWPYKARAGFDTYYIRDKTLQKALENIKISIEVDEDTQDQWLTLWGEQEVVTEELRLLLCETIRAIIKRNGLSRDSILYTYLDQDEQIYKDLGFEESGRADESWMSTFGQLLERCDTEILKPRENRIAERASEWVKLGTNRARNNLKTTWEQYCDTSDHLGEEYTRPELLGLGKAFGIKNRHKMAKKELCQRIATFLTIMETGIHPQNLLGLEVV